MIYLILAIVLVILIASILYLYQEFKLARLKEKEVEIKNEVNKEPLSDLVASNNANKSKS